VHRKKIRISDAPEEQDCVACSRTWFDDSEYACQLKCGHWICLECTVRKVDDAGRGNLIAGEKDPDVKYWRCPTCQDINPVLVDRVDIMKDDEIAYWRYKVARHRLDTFLTDWVTHLWGGEAVGWFPPLPPHLQHDRVDAKDIVKARTVRVKAREAVQFMEEVPLLVTGLLDWGFSLDNPNNTAEGDVLKDRIIAELQSLEKSGQKFYTEEMIAHMQKVGKDAVRTVVVKDKQARLGNPDMPPGYTAYQEFLCEWTARGCFLAGCGRNEIAQFMKDIKNKKGAWWKDVREVWFNRGT
jgi:hypothetical protein